MGFAGHVRWDFAVTCGGIKHLVGQGRHDGITKGFYYDVSEETVIDLILPNFTGATAFDANNNGEVIGYGCPVSCTFVQGFMYSNGILTQLTPTNWIETRPMSINDNGDVVGWGMGPNGGRSGFLYSNGEFTIFDDFRPGNTEIYDINNNGVMVGFFKDIDNMTDMGFIATPVVPEPISSILFIAGGALLAGRRYLRRKKIA